MKRGRLLAIAALAGLAGCAGRDYQAPSPPAKAEWSSPEASDGATAAATNATNATIPLQRWWTSLHDTALDAYMAAVLAANHDARLASERLREARASLGISQAALAPTVDASGAASRSRVSGNGPLGSHAGGVGNLYQAGFDASWEIDLFGGIRREVEAAEADLAAWEENRRDVLVSVAAEAVRSWLDWRAAAARRELAQRGADNAREQGGLIGQRRGAGLADDAAVAAAEAATALAEAALPPLVIQERQALDRLACLAGRAPGPMALLPTDLPAVLPATADIFALALPADLVRQRPDLRRAERELAAATARIGVAEADLYPRLSLTGSFGQQSVSGGSFADSGSTFWSLGPSVRWPIFSAGRIRHAITAADARAAQAALRFEQAALAAYAEVEDALVALANDRQREGHLVAAAAARARQAALTRDRQQNGLADRLAVLRCEADHLAALDQVLAARRTSGIDCAALAKSLGGGWEAAP